MDSGQRGPPLLPGATFSMTGQKIQKENKQVEPSYAWDIKAWNKAPTGIKQYKCNACAKKVDVKICLW